MSRTMMAMTALVLGSGFLLSIARGDEPAEVRINTVLVDDVNATVPSGKAPENAARLELVGSGDFIFVDGGPPSKYWIGLGCELVTDALKSQLGLTEKQALLVTMVAENSPAKAAGFQVHDVITTVKFDDETKPLDSVATLTRTVAKAEQKPIVLSVVRQGRSQEITVAPMERPQASQDVLVQNVTGFDIAVAPPGVPANPQRVQQLLRELQALIGAQPQPTTIHFTGPVVAPQPVPVPPGVPHIVVMTKAPLPDDVTVTISKTGKDPVRIKYQKGENNWWGATETEINTLPPEGRNALQVVLTALQQVLPHPVVPGFTSLNVSGAGVVSEWPVRSVYNPVRYLPQSESLKGQGPNSAAGVTGKITTAVVAPPAVPATTDVAARLQVLEKHYEQLQKQQQELMTRQQETLRKEFQSLRETLEKIERK